MARYFDPGEMSELQAAQTRRRAYETYRAMANPDTAASVNSMAKTYPTMRPGEVLPLAKAGVKPDSPVAKKAAQTSARRGWGWHSVGDVVGGAISKFGGVVKNVADEAIYDPVKGISRGMAIGLQAPGEALQGQFRNRVADGSFSPGDVVRMAVDPFDWKQTTAAAGIDEIRREGVTFRGGGGGADYGSGFFPGGDVYKIQRERAMSAAPLIGGKGVTMGRYTAAKVFEPGTRRYGTLSGLIDATVAIGTDPTSYIGGSSRRAIEAGKTFQGSKGMKAVVAKPDPRVELAKKRVLASKAEGLIDEEEAQQALEAAGALSGHPRKTVLPERVAEWLDGKQGRQVRDYLATETSFERMRRVTKGKVDVETLVKLTDAKSDAEVLDILGPELGVNIRQRFGASKGALEAVQGGNGFRAKRINGSRSRMAAQMPGTHMDLEDPDSAVQTVEDFLRNVKVGEMDKIGKWTEKMARATDRNGRFAVTRDMLAEVRDDVLAESGAKLTDGQRGALTRMYDDYDETLRRYAIDEVGDNATVPGAIIGGDGKPLPTPHLFNEYVNTTVPLPDARELRRATSAYVNLIDKAKLRPGYDAVNTIADFTTQQMFKPLVLARAAWTVRVVGEEQIRLAASGLTSAFVHPMSHIALATGKKGGKGITGDALMEADEMQEAMSRGASGFLKRTNLVRTKHRRVLDRAEAQPKQFAEALLDEVGKLHHDPVMRRVLNGLEPGDLHPNSALTGIDAVKDWFFNGTGRKFRDEMASADTKAGDRAFLGVKADPEGGINSADGYIDSLLERAKTMSGGDQRLLDAIATGQIDGIPLSSKMANGSRQINRAALAKLGGLLEEGVGPQMVPADLMVHTTDTAGTKALAMYDKGVEVMFNTLMSRPTNFLSRNPAFQQYYWKRTAELVERMTPETQAAAIKVARDTGLSPKLIKQMEKSAARMSGDLNVAEADVVAKAFGLDSTRKLLYDLSSRGQFFDITRAIFPFGEAWQEVATTWARIGFLENPVALRRAQQVVTGLRSADTDGDGQGFFYTDEQTGEEVFNYPFSGWISEKLTGVPAPLQASAKGLNIFATSVIPGVGPMVQIPAGKLIPNTPEYDDMRTLLLPFGERDMSGGYLESFAPAWLQKGLIAAGKRSPEQQRLYANTVMDSARYLVSTGKYSMDSRDEQTRTLEAAETMASKVYAYRSLAQFFAPSPPSPEFVTRDKNGEAVFQVQMVGEFRKLQDEDYTTATEKFIDKFGEDAFLTTISKTTGAGAPTPELYEFIQRNPDVVRTHSEVYGYFVTGDGEFSNDAYQHQLRSGERKPITPKQALRIANQRLGGMAYRQAQSKVRQKGGKPAPTAEERLWLAEVRDAIVEEYPGYNSTPANLRDQKELIDSMVSAAQDPVLRKTDAGRGLAKYLELRQEGIDLARERKLTGFTSAKRAADIRSALREGAAEIGEEHPDFIELFDRTFNREMISDDPEEVTS